MIVCKIDRFLYVYRWQYILLFWFTLSHYVFFSLTFLWLFVAIVLVFLNINKKEKFKRINCQLKTTIMGFDMNKNLGRFYYCCLEHDFSNWCEPLEVNSIFFRYQLSLYLKSWWRVFHKGYFGYYKYHLKIWIFILFILKINWSIYIFNKKNQQLFFCFLIQTEILLNNKTTIRR